MTKSEFAASIRMDSELYEELRQLAILEDRTLSNMMRRILKSWLWEKRELENRLNQ